MSGVFRIVQICALIVAVMGSMIPDVIAATGLWHWVWLTPSGQGWDVIEGDAVVVFAGQDFSTTLRGHSRDYEPTLLVQGRVRDGRVEARVVQMGTDASPEQYIGEIKSTRTKLSDPSNGWGDDRISLRDRSSFLGFYRSIRSEEGQP
jgi:hypothetical protein